MDTVSHPTRKRDLYSERLATKANVQEKCREPKHDDHWRAEW